jgi:hypothetical protein
MSHQYGSKEGWNEIGTATMTLIWRSSNRKPLGKTTTELKNRRATWNTKQADKQLSAETVVGNIMRDR